MKNSGKLNDVKMCVIDKAKWFGENYLAFMEEHGPSVMWTVLIGGILMIIHSDMKYMRMLNKAAKSGKFLWLPGKGSQI